MCFTVLNKRINYFIISRSASMASDPSNPRKIIFITCRAGPTESASNYVLRGLVDQFLDKSSAQSRFLRLNYTLVVVPVLNPDAVLLGNYKNNVNGQSFLSNSTLQAHSFKQLFPETFYLNKLILKLNSSEENSKIVHYTHLSSEWEVTGSLMRTCVNDKAEISKMMDWAMMFGEFANYFDSHKCRFEEELQVTTEDTTNQSYRAFQANGKSYASLHEMIRHETGLKDSYTFVTSSTGTDRYPLDLPDYEQFGKSYAQCLSYYLFKKLGAKDAKAGTILREMEEKTYVYTQCLQNQELRSEILAKAVFLPRKCLLSEQATAQGSKAVDLTLTANKLATETQNPAYLVEFKRSTTLLAEKMMAFIESVSTSPMKGPQREEIIQEFFRGSTESKKQRESTMKKTKNGDSPFDTKSPELFPNDIDHVEDHRAAFCLKVQFSAEKDNSKRKSRRNSENLSSTKRLDSMIRMMHPDRGGGTNSSKLKNKANGGIAEASRLEYGIDINSFEVQDSQEKIFLHEDHIRSFEESTNKYSYQFEGCTKFEQAKFHQQIKGPLSKIPEDQLKTEDGLSIRLKDNSSKNLSSMRTTQANVFYTLHQAETDSRVSQNHLDNLAYLPQLSKQNCEGYHPTNKSQTQRSTQLQASKQSREVIKLFRKSKDSSVDIPLGSSETQHKNVEEAITEPTGQQMDRRLLKKGMSMPINHQAAREIISRENRDQKSIKVTRKSPYHNLTNKNSASEISIASNEQAESTHYQTDKREGSSIPRQLETHRPKISSNHASLSRGEAFRHPKSKLTEGEIQIIDSNDIVDPTTKTGAYEDELDSASRSESEFAADYKEPYLPKRNSGYRSRSREHSRRLTENLCRGTSRSIERGSLASIDLQSSNNHIAIRLKKVYLNEALPSTQLDDTQRLQQTPSLISPSLPPKKSSGDSTSMSKSKIVKLNGYNIVFSQKPNAVASLTQRHLQRKEQQEQHRLTLSREGSQSNLRKPEVSNFQENTGNSVQFGVESAAPLIPQILKSHKRSSTFNKSNNSKSNSVGHTRNCSLAVGEFPALNTTEMQEAPQTKLEKKVILSTFLLEQKINQGKLIKALQENYPRTLEQTTTSTASHPRYSLAQPKPGHIQSSANSTFVKNFQTLRSMEGVSLILNPDHKLDKIGTMLQPISLNKDMLKIKSMVQETMDHKPSKGVKSKFDNIVRLYHKSTEVNASNGASHATIECPRLDNKENLASMDRNRQPLLRISRQPAEK